MIYIIYMRKSNVLVLAEENNYSFAQLHGTQVPVFWFTPKNNPDNILEIAVVNEGQYQPNRQLTEVERHMVNQLFIEMRNHKEYDDSHEFKLIAYDFSLDNNE